MNEWRKSSGESMERRKAEKSISTSHERTRDTIKKSSRNVPSSCHSSFLSWRHHLSNLKLEFIEIDLRYIRVNVSIEIWELLELPKHSSELLSGWRIENVNKTTCRDIFVCNSVIIKYWMLISQTFSTTVDWFWFQ